MISRVVSSCSLVLLLASLAFSTATQRSRKPQSPPLPEKQKAAEAAADRVMRRFYDTLDFSIIYKELYVSEPLKKKEVQIIIGNVLLQGTKDLKIPPIDFAVMERAYIAQQNFHFLVSAENFTDESVDETFEGELKTNFEKYYMSMMSPANWPILTAEQLDSRFTANLDHMSEFFRKHVVSRNFGTDLYLRKIASFKESRGPEQGLIRLFGLSQKIYVVQRERLHLYFVEENGEFRMLSATQRVMD